jgi:hypothetical protein
MAEAIAPSLRGPGRNLAHAELLADVFDVDRLTPVVNAGLRRSPGTFGHPRGRRSGPRLCYRLCLRRCLLPEIVERQHDSRRSCTIGGRGPLARTKAVALEVQIEAQGCIGRTRSVHLSQDLGGHTRPSSGSPLQTTKCRFQQRIQFARGAIPAKVVRRQPASHGLQRTGIQTADRAALLPRADPWPAQASAQAFRSPLASRLA